VAWDYVLQVMIGFFCNNYSSFLNLLAVIDMNIEVQDGYRKNHELLFCLMVILYYLLLRMPRKNSTRMARVIA
jgi:hypothetical protein